MLVPMKQNPAGSTEYLYIFLDIFFWKSSNNGFTQPLFAAGSCNKTVYVFLLSVFGVYCDREEVPKNILFFQPQSDNNRQLSLRYDIIYKKFEGVQL